MKKNQWPCKVCFRINHIKYSVCYYCGAPKPVIKAETAQ